MWSDAGYPKSKNTAHDTVEPADDGEPILAFDVTIPNVPKPPPGPVRDPVEMRRAMEAAMRRGRQQYLDTVGNDRPPHCGEFCIKMSWSHLIEGIYGVQ